MQQINLGIIGTGWCGGIRAVTASRSPLVRELHLAEIDPNRLEDIAAQTNPTPCDRKLGRDRRQP